MKKYYVKGYGFLSFATSKRAIQKTAEATGDLVGNKIANNSQKFQQRHNKIIKRQLQMTIIKKYQKKDKYLRDKGKKLLMKLD